MADRFAVRRRPDGWAVVDTEGYQSERRFPREDKADTACRALNDLDRNGHEYTVVWGVEVLATSEEDAVKKARKYLAPSYRDNWTPISVELIEGEQ